MKTISYLISFFLIIMLYSSCQKGILVNHDNDMTKNIIQQVDEWLNSQIVKETNSNSSIDISSNEINDNRFNSFIGISNFNISIAEQNSNILHLKQCIDASYTKTEKRDNNISFLIIPIKEEYKAKIKFDKNSTLSLFLVIDKLGKILSGSILCFEPKDGKRQNGYKSFTLKNIFNNMPIKDDGTFKFYGVNGILQYQFQFEESKIKSFAIIKPKNKTLGKNNAVSGCTDWYLVTTYYYSDGTTNVVESYLGTTCSNVDPGVGGGGGNGGNDGGAPPNTENTVTYSVKVSSFSSDLTNDEDGANFSVNQSSYGTIPTNYIRLKYTHTASVEYVTFAGYTIVSSVFPNPTTADPMSSPFIDSRGFSGTRDITLLGHYNTWESLTPPFIRINWRVDVHGRYINNQPNVYTKQWTHNHSENF